MQSSTEVSQEHLAYRAELEQIAESFRRTGVMARIVGNGAGQLLVVDRDERGAELYWNPEGVFLDPAVDGQLLGEVRFDSLDSAMETATLWLKSAVLPSEATER